MGIISTGIVRTGIVNSIGNCTPPLSVVFYAATHDPVTFELLDDVLIGIPMVASVSTES